MHLFEVPKEKIEKEKIYEDIMAECLPNLVESIISYT